MSFRDIEDLLAQRRVIASYEPIRRWCLKFGPCYQRSLKRREGQLGDHWFVDEVFVSIGGQQHYLWRSVDQDGDVLDILVQRRRNRAGAERFFEKYSKAKAWNPDAWSPMDSKAIPLQFTASCWIRSTIQLVMQTTGQRIHISIRVVESDKCSVSSPYDKRNDFLGCIVAWVIYFDTADF